MKKYITVCFIVVFMFFTYRFVNLNYGFYIDFNPGEPVKSFAKSDEDSIYVDKGEGFEKLVVKGVELDAAIPGYFPTDYQVDEETYLRWLGLIKDMGANTVRLNQIMDDSFYNAFYEFNENREDPLYLMQSIWVTDYAQNSHNSAYSKEFSQKLTEDCYTAVDVIHGKRNISLGRVAGSGNYRHDVSKWTIGYIVGTTWSSYTIAYTDDKDIDRERFSGEYIYTTEHSSAFENMLAGTLDGLLSYESKKYKTQRLVSFVSEPATDPFKYLYNSNIQIDKIAKIDSNNIMLTDKVISGFFASYNMYSNYTHFVKCLDDSEKIRLKEYIDKIDTHSIYDGYIQMLNLYHKYPVLVSSYGYSTSRCAENNDAVRMNEYMQGTALKDTYVDMIDSGCCGALIASWQDDWSHATWNTQHSINVERTKRWSDYQTVDQSYGLLTFDPGKEKSVCYVDGDVSEWKEEDKIASNLDMSLSVKYDEKFVYMMVNKKDLSEEDTLLIPIDTTQKTGSNYCEGYDAKFERAADFLIVLNGRNNSRVLVQRRYDVTRAMYEKSITGEEPYDDVPDRDIPIFDKTRIVLKKQYDPTVNLEALRENQDFEFNMYKTYETGLLTYGNANPDSPGFNSLSDYFIEDDSIELRIPWQLLNFSDPSQMMIHDDYYENYGVEEIPIDKMYVGIGSINDSSNQIPMGSIALEGWKDKATYHERLKESYYIIKKLWTE